MDKVNLLTPPSVVTLILNLPAGCLMSLVTVVPYTYSGKDYTRLENLILSNLLCLSNSAMVQVWCWKWEYSAYFWLLSIVMPGAVFLKATI